MAHSLDSTYLYSLSLLLSGLGSQFYNLFPIIFEAATEREDETVLFLSLGGFLLRS